MTVGEPLVAVLAEAQRRGLIGARPIAWHIGQAESYASALVPGARIIDLGSGGGLPGLPLAVFRPDLAVTLLDARDRAAQWLRQAVVALARPDITVVHSRAEAFVATGRGSFDAVVSRGFGSPADLAECAAPLLVPGGVLVVSAANAGEHWDPEGLRALGLRLDGIVSSDFGALVVARLVGSCASAFPRPVSIRRRRPLWSGGRPGA